MKVNLLLRIWWIASANPPYANIPHKLNRRTAVLNETDWQAAIPVPRERLPVVNEQQAFAAI